MKMILTCIITITLSLNVVASAKERSGSTEKQLKTITTSHRKAAEELLELNNAESVLIATYATVEQAIANKILPITPSSESKPIIDKYIKIIKQAMKEEVSWEKMKPPLVDAYVSVYSEKIIKQAARFYRSEAGKQMLQHQPEIMNASTAIIKDMSAKLLPRLQVIQFDMAKELQGVKITLPKNTSL
ncbi:MAG: DUF2059 domain-containing protein [Candidatus Endonucleobacter bathymodioli]|uniref:DUF2059 domain-containing protein n=1 Tax=Candidatus Endonucleibacter bathymodioli TaxID=539814 RepID=A0AA90NSH3_9GAMM|nr:DUF2059 domain-containing protein [Candidatus Endonucleobacter bathymodioli]